MAGLYVWDSSGRLRNILFNYHLTLIKGCKDILEPAHQDCGTEKTEHRIFWWLPFDRNKTQKERKMLMRNSYNHSWTNYLTYPNIMMPHNVNL